jgi:hypothetical protein
MFVYHNIVDFIDGYIRIGRSFILECLELLCRGVVSGPDTCTYVLQQVGLYEWMIMDPTVTEGHIKKTQL